MVWNLQSRVKFDDSSQNIQRARSLIVKIDVCSKDQMSRICYLQLRPNYFRNQQDPKMWKLKRKAKEMS